MTTERHQSTTTLQHYNTTTLQHYNTTTLQHYNTTTLQHYNTTTLQHYNTTAKTLMPHITYRYVDMRTRNCKCFECVKISPGSCIVHFTSFLEISGKSSKSYFNSNAWVSSCTHRSLGSSRHWLCSAFVCGKCLVESFASKPSRLEWAQVWEPSLESSHTKRGGTFRGAGII
jgi:hypothetical protein